MGSKTGNQPPGGDTIWAGPDVHRPQGFILLVLVSAALVLTFVVWLVTTPIPAGDGGSGSDAGDDAQPPSATATVSPPTSQPDWFAPFHLNLSSPILSDLAMDDIIVAASEWSGAVVFRGLDLSERRIIWTVSGQNNELFFGDSTGFVVTLDDQIQVVDPRTGQVTAQAPLLISQDLYWAGEGLILTRDWNGPIFCVRAMEDPATCLWQAKGVTLPPKNQMVSDDYVFGGGLWVNTGDGVRDLVTGKPASFGRDAGIRSGSLVYYAGSSPQRVFRVVYDGKTAAGRDIYTYQPWDVVRDVGVSPPVRADNIHADPASPVYVASVGPENPADYTSPDVSTAYLWQTGEQKWQIDTVSINPSPSQFVGDAYVTDAVSGDMRFLVALDVMTGQTIWQSDYFMSLSGVRQDVIYVEGAGDVSAYDATNGFQFLWQVESPLDSPDEWWADVLVMANHVFCLDLSEARIWVLDD